MYHIYVTWISGITTKSNKGYRTKETASKSVAWLMKNFAGQVRVVEIA